MQRRIFLDEEGCGWQCDIDKGIVIDGNSDIKGQPIPSHWEEDVPAKSNLMPNKPLQWDVIHGQMY